MTGPRVEKAYERYAWTIPFALAAFNFVEGLFILLTSGANDPSLKEITGLTYDQLSSTYPAIASLIALDNRVFGLTLSGFTFFIMAVSLKSYRRGERWSWYALWSLPVFFGLAAAVDNPAFASVFIIIALVSLLGLLLPYRKFFPKT